MKRSGLRTPWYTSIRAGNMMEYGPEKDIKHDEWEQNTTTVSTIQSSSRAWISVLFMLSFSVYLRTDNYICFSELHKFFRQNENVCLLVKDSPHNEVRNNYFINPHFK